MNAAMSEGINEYSKVVDNILRSYNWSDKEYSYLTDNIAELVKKTNDDCMNLGIIGSFSSGKSTMLNSLMSKNLLATDAVQGTTVSTTKIRQAAKNDLVIHYDDKNVLRFSTDQELLCKKYAVAYKPQNTSPWQMFLRWLINLFALKKEEERSGNASDIPADIMEMFTKISSKEEFASDISMIVLEYMNEKLPQGIALVDTPGTESTNSRHLVVTQTAIDYICDAVVVIIPFDEPVSQALVHFLKGSLSAYLDKCIFVVTKIELLDDITELPRLLKTIEQRLINNLGIEHPLVLGLPTLLYLENTDKEMKPTGLFDSMDAETKTELLALYDKNNDILLDTLFAKKQDFILNKINIIRTRIRKKLADALETTAHQKKAERVQRERDIPIPLSAFIDNASGLLYEMCQDSKRGFEQRPQLYSIVINNLLSNSVAQIEACDSSQQIVYILSDLNALLWESFETITQSLEDDEKEQISKCDEFLKQVHSEFLSTYWMCLPSSQKGASMGNSDVFHGYIEVEYGRMAEELRNSVNHMTYAIGASTSGFKNKLKSFFSNPTQKNIENSTYELRSIMGAIAGMLEDAVRKNMEEMLDFYASNTKDKIVQHYNLYSETIEDYIKANNGEISILKDEEAKIYWDLQSISDIEQAISNSIITLKKEDFKGR